MFKKYIYRTLASILEIIEILIISLYNGLLGGFLIPYRNKWNNLIYRIFNRVLERYSKIRYDFITTYGVIRYSIVAYIDNNYINNKITEVPFEYRGLFKRGYWTKGDINTKIDILNVSEQLLQAEHKMIKNIKTIHTIGYIFVNTYIMAYTVGIVTAIITMVNAIMFLIDIGIAVVYKNIDSDTLALLKIIIFCTLGIIYYTKVQQTRIENVFKYIYYNRSILNYKFKVQGRE